jgi:hypothetical protein
MPTNLPPEAIDKWEEVEAAHTPQEKLKKILGNNVSGCRLLENFLTASEPGLMAVNKKRELIYVLVDLGLFLRFRKLGFKFSVLITQTAHNQECSLLLCLFVGEVGKVRLNVGFVGPKQLKLADLAVMCFRELDYSFDTPPFGSFSKKVKRGLCPSSTRLLEPYLRLGISMWGCRSGKYRTAMSCRPSSK